ncbi:MAG TPA: YciI family protein [Candidatus Nitrosotenuis sp.]|jgi:uncharacterized protein YciI|nr:YciI family protein [Candidatus Nitrosotenuis sp.]
MKFFVVILRYLVDVDTILKNREDHIIFLQKYYDRGIFIVSGPQCPRTGGIILAKTESRDRLMTILTEDPFVYRKLVEVQIYEFIPNHYHSDFTPFINRNP